MQIVGGGVGVVVVVAVDSVSALDRKEFFYKGRKYTKQSCHSRRVYTVKYPFE
jgi:hypothetical protein